jgi:hypothetical protein
MIGPGSNGNSGEGSQEWNAGGNAGREGQAHEVQVGIGLHGNWTEATQGTLWQRTCFYSAMP